MASSHFFRMNPHKHADKASLLSAMLATQQPTLGKLFMELKYVVPWGRSFDEYQKMFSLTEGDLKKTILGCSDGPASFNAELTARGGDVISVDPAYQFDTLSLKKRISEVYDEVMPQMYSNKDQYVWESISSVDMLGKVRMDAMNTFLSDYENGKRAGRYIQEALPKLSFRDNEFDLALCSHYLFLYSDHISLDEHIASIKELCRVAKEVGIYPLLSLDGGLSPHFNAALPELEKVGLIAFLAEANYQFQKGATQMLVVKTM